MASITKYRGKYRIQDKTKGFKPISKTFAKHAEAIAFKRSVEAARAAGRDIDLSAPALSNMTVRGLLEWYLGLEEVKGKASFKSEAHASKHVLRLLGNLDPVEVRDHHLNTYRTTRLATPVKVGNHKTERQPKPQTVNHELKLINRAYVLAVSEFKWVLPNGIPKARKPAVKNGRNRRVPRDELGRIVQASDSPELAVIAELAVETAMRRGELAGLRRELVNLKARSVLLPKTKNGTARTVPLSTRAVALLKPYVKGKEGDVFTMAPGSISQAFKRAAKRAGAANVVFHDLRHEAISRLFEAGKLNLIEIARITGHKTLSQLDRYTHLAVGHLVSKLD